MSIYVNHTNNTTLQRCISRHLSKMMCDKYNLRYIYPPSPIPDVHIENSWPHNIIGNILFASTLFSYHVFMMFYKELVVFCVQYAEGTQLLGYTTWQGNIAFSRLSHQTLHHGVVRHSFLLGDSGYTYPFTNFGVVSFGENNVLPPTKATKTNMHVGQMAVFSSTTGGRSPASWMAFTIIFGYIAYVRQFC